MATESSDTPNGGTVTSAVTPTLVKATAVGEHIPHPSQQERRDAGRPLRNLVPHASHGAWKPAADRPDPAAREYRKTMARLATTVHSDTTPVSRFGRICQDRVRHVALRRRAYPKDAHARRSIRAGQSHSLHA